MFWWVLFGTLTLICGGFILRGIQVRWKFKIDAICIGIFGAIALFILILAISFSVQSKQNIQNMKYEKQFIEHQYELIDIAEDDFDKLALEIAVKDASFQYGFKLSQMKISQANYGILSKYYGIDLSKLDLKLGRNY